MRIVFIMVDTLRYDFLKMGGADRSYAPDIDRFAEGATFFDQQYVSSFPTAPNREDIMTGRYSFPHHGWGPLPDDATPAAEILQNAGYLTQLICDTPHLLGTGHGYHRGFEGYHWLRGNECDFYLTRYNRPRPRNMPFEKTRKDVYRMGMTLADMQFWLNPDINWEEQYHVARTAKATSRWIEENYKAEDFFLWIDTFQLHEPWLPPAYLQERYDPKHKGELTCYPNYGMADCYSKAELRNMRALYAGEASLVSKWIGHILRKLEDVGIYDDTLIGLCADHGTYLGEYNRAGKAMLGGKNWKEWIPWPQYDEVNRIPLIVKMPGQKKGRRVKELVQPVDYLPTWLDLAGVKTDVKIEGHSLKPLLSGSSRAKWPRKQAASSNSIRARYPNYWTALNTSRWLLNVGGDEGDKPILNDKRGDPGCRKNVARENPNVVKRMGRDYLKLLEMCGTEPEKIEFARSQIGL